MSWRDYHKNRLLKEESGFYVIVPEENVHTVPLACPVCDRLFRSVDDMHAYHAFECCSECANVWAYKAVDAWNSGWRPSRDEIEKNLEERQPIRVNVRIDY